MIEELNFGAERDEKFAVLTEKVHLVYGSSEKSNPALNGVSLHAPTGRLYGLLGPSGCGKTSILKIVCGLLRQDYGEVKVFGYKPREYGSGVPGPGIGYMPQEMALPSDFKVAEVLSYFGRLNFMSKYDVVQQTDHLLKLLDIPEQNRLIGQMSTGQQRRLSLACAIIHKPRLAILDEPTVATDPLLCSKIWKLLQILCTESKMTIIITTHYIEEARRAQVVGFMRKGQILVEGEPGKLMHRFDSSCLEDVFLRICINQSHKACDVQQSSNEKNKAQMDIQLLKTYSDTHPIGAFSTIFGVLLWRYLLQINRNQIFLGLVLFIPLSNILTLQFCIGPSPKNLPTAWVAEDEPEYGILYATVGNYSVAYEQYLVPFYPEIIKRTLDKQIVDLRAYGDFETAVRAFEKYDVKGIIHLKRGFPQAFHKKIEFLSGSESDETGTREVGSIHLFLDHSNPFLRDSLHLAVQLSIFKTIELTKEASLSKRVSGLPIKFIHDRSEKIFQLKDTGIGKFIIPAIMLNIFFGCALGVSGLSIRTEIDDQMFDRSLSTSLTALEMIIAQIISRLLYYFPAALYTLLVAFTLVGSPIELYSFALSYCLLILDIIAGLLCGIMFGCIFSSMQTLMFSTLSFTMVMIYIGGQIWPLEGLPYFLHWLSWLTPFTYPTYSLRELMLDGDKSFSHVVLPGLLMSVAWNIFLSIITYNSFKLKCKLK